MTDPIDRPVGEQPEPMPGDRTAPIEDASHATRRHEQPPADTAAIPPEPQPGRPAAALRAERDGLGRTRTSALWMGLIATAVFLILLIIFIAQNSRTVPLHLFGWHGQFSLALTILLSAVIGVLVVAIPGSVRMWQLRRAARRNLPDRRGR